MRLLDTPEDLALLSAYLRKSVALGSVGLGDVSPHCNVTAIMYFFWSEEKANEKWIEFEGALLETWRKCGLLKTVIVSNLFHRCLQKFAERFDNVEIQLESSLIPGDIVSMSYDCNARLYQRFQTDFVLIVQNDGFPLRRGLDEFVDAGYDFIGAPHCRPAFLPSLMTKVLRFCPSNGGFSLRTRKLCEIGAKLWRDGGFEKKPYVEDVMAEDYFFTKTLPLSGIGYWLKRNQASSAFSDYFSYGATFSLTLKRLPFGFHTATGFAALVRRFGDSILSVNS